MQVMQTAETMLSSLSRNKNNIRMWMSVKLLRLVARAIRNAIRANRLQIDSRESFAIESPIFIARQADSPESPIRANHATKLLRIEMWWHLSVLSMCCSRECSFHDRHVL